MPPSHRIRPNAAIAQPTRLTVLPVCFHPSSSVVLPHTPLPAMNPRLLRHVLAFTATICFAVPVKAEDTNTHRFGETIYVQGDSLDWVSAHMSGNIRHDLYADTNNTEYQVTLTSRPDVSTTLAHVSGTTSQGGVDGRMENGDYFDNFEEYDDGSGNSGYTSYTVNLASGQVTYYSESNWADWEGNGGYSWYDSVTGDSWSEDTYIYNDGDNSSQTTYWTSTLGTITTSGQYYSTSSWYYEEPSYPQSFQSLFGKTFNFDGGSHSSNEERDGVGNLLHFDSSYQDNYSGNGGSFSINYSYNSNGTPQSSYQIQGTDPDIGNFSAYVTGSTLPSRDSIVWAPRTSASFGFSHFWLNGMLYTWQTGALSSNGNVTDTYTTAGGGQIVTVVGHLPDFISQTSSASMLLDGANIGTVSAPDQVSTAALYQISLSETDSSSSQPFFVDSYALWLDGVRFDFVAGYSGNNAHHMDLYRNPTAGSVMLTGSTQGSGNVAGHQGTSFFSGTFSGGSFTLSSNYQLASVEPVTAQFPSALWVRGLIYLKDAAVEGGHEYLSGDSQNPSAFGVLTLTLDGAVFSVSGQDSLGGFVGDFPAAEHLAVVETLAETPSPVLLLALGVNDEGYFPIQPAAGCAPGLPPAVAIQNDIYSYVGMAALASGSGQSSIYVKSTNLELAPVLAIHAGEDAVLPATVFNSELAVLGTGTYNTVSYLFQTSTVQAEQLPTPMFSANSLYNHIILLSGSPPEGLPPSFIVRGTEAWWYAGMEGDQAVYTGFYYNQQLTVAPEDSAGQRRVDLTEVINDETVETFGVLNDVRGSVRMRDGTVVYSGNFQGSMINPELADNRLHTIEADLDITGNVLSFGALQGDAAVAGVTLQFFDHEGTATLASALGRHNAEWLWFRAGDAPTSPAEPMMKLDTLNRLTLHDPAQPSGLAGILLDPADGGVSTFRGTLRVRPGGDILMGPYTTSPVGLSAP